MESVSLHRLARPSLIADEDGEEVAGRIMAYLARIDLGVAKGIVVGTHLD